MKVELRYQPAYSVARCHLAGGEAVRAESGAMVAHSSGMHLEAAATGGLLKGLKRSVLGGESMYVSTFTAPAEGGWLDVASPLPGDMACVMVTEDRPMHITRGCWIANAMGVEIETKWAGMKNLFGGEGAGIGQATGSGEVILAAFGTVDEINLEPGQTVTIDSGHVVAYDANMGKELRRAVEGRSIQSSKSGEGFVFDFTGPGRVFIQTRNANALIEWLTARLPFSRG